MSNANLDYKDINDDIMNENILSDIYPRYKSLR